MQYKKYFAYKRVSCQKSADNQNSLPTQERVIREHAAKTDAEIVTWYEDVHSAFRGKRPAFARMIADLQTSPEVAGLIVHKLDRSARNMKDFALLNECMEQGKDIVVVEGSLDTTTSSGRLAFRNHCNHAVYYSENLSEEMTEKVAQRLIDGYFPSVTFQGYRNGGKADPDPKKKYMDPVQGPLVAEAFRLMFQGSYSSRSLARHMRERGMVNRNAKPISKSEILRILRNPFYHGLMRWKTRKTGRILHYQGNHEPLITQDLFDGVQAVLDNRTAKHKSTHDNTYAKTFHCRCGRFLIPSTHKDHRYMVCQNKECEFTSIRETALEDSILVALSRLHLSDLYLGHAQEAFRRIVATRRERDAAAQAALQAEISKVQSRLVKIRELVLSGFFSPEEILPEKDLLTQKEGSLNLRLKALQTSPNSGDEAMLIRAVQQLCDIPLLYRALNPVLKRRVIYTFFAVREIQGDRPRLEPHSTLQKAQVSDALARATQTRSNPVPYAEKPQKQARKSDPMASPSQNEEKGGSNGGPDGQSPHHDVDLAWSQTIKNEKLGNGGLSGPKLGQSTTWLDSFIDESVSELVAFLMSESGRVFDLLPTAA